MRSLTPEGLAALLAAHPAPCVSLYQPTQRRYPDTQQGPIRYRNSLRRAEEQLRGRYPAGAVKSLLERFAPLADDPLFWTRRLDGIAVFAAPDVFEVYDFQRPVPEQVVVADSFHIKPLLRQLQTADRYQVLCLSRTRVHMLEGNRDTLDEIDLRGVPATVEEALGTEVRVQRKEDVPGGKGPGEQRPAPRGAGVPGGHPAKGDDAKLDDERFFRAIDRAVWERHSRPSGLPLLLAALPEHQATFRAVSHNQQLLPRGLEQNPDALSLEQLRDAAWKVVEPFHEQRTREHLDNYQMARVKGMGTDELAKAAQAARQGRVGILLVDADRHKPGRLDPETGKPQPAGGNGDGADDMLDELAEQVLRTKGTVFVLPGSVMPTTTGLAAVLRY